MQTTEPKHTPAPWVISPSSKEVPWSIQAPNGETICNICTGDDEQVEMADARLIAAAPDLAAALVAVSRSLDLQRARMQEEFDCLRSADKKAILTPRLEAMARALETAKSALAKLSS